MGLSQPGAAAATRTDTEEERGVGEDVERKVGRGGLVEGGGGGESLIDSGRKWLRWLEFAS